MRITRKEFETLVISTIEEIPKLFRDKMENIDLVIEKFPSNQLLSQMELQSPYDLLGLYQGVPFNQRGFYYGNVLPDKITLFQIPIESGCKNKKEIKERIKEVIIHELGHYLGLDEDDLKNLDTSSTINQKIKGEV